MIAKSLLLFFFALMLLPCFASTSPAPALSGPIFRLENMRARQIEKLTGKKLSLIQKLEWGLFRKKLNKIGDDRVVTEQQRKQAKWSLTLGIASIILLFIPTISILALPAAILGLILGIKSVKGNSNGKGIAGIVLSSLTLLLLVLVIFLLALYVFI